MMQRQIIYLALSLMFWNVSNAQDKMPSELNQLVTECQNVVALNDTINARQERLNDLKERLELIKQSWWQSCNDALSSSNCDSKDIRLATLDELISLTDPTFEAELLAQLVEAKNDPTIWTLRPISQTTPIGRKTTSKREPEKEEATTQRGPAAAPVQTTPVADEQPKDERSEKKDNPSTSPKPNDAKERSDEQAAPGRQGTKGREDKSNIDSKGETNRNKTINTVKDKLNTNK